MIWAVLIPALIRPDLAVILAGVAALSVGLALTPRQPIARAGALIALALSARLLAPALLAALIALEYYRQG